MRSYREGEWIVTGKVKGREGERIATGKVCLCEVRVWRGSA